MPVPRLSPQAWMALSAFLQAKPAISRYASLEPSWLIWLTGSPRLPFPSALFIACWELLSQIALLWLVHSMLPPRSPSHLPVHAHLSCMSCDNAVAESASWKGLSTAKGLCHLLCCVLHFQEDRRVSAHVNRIPGILNDTADKLSRSVIFVDPSSLGFLPDQLLSPPWAALSSLPVIQTYPPGLDLLPASQSFALS